MTEERKAELLKDFLEEFFDFDELRSVGFFNESIQKDDYKAQAERICSYFGLSTIYEYRVKVIKGHISYADPTGKPFVTHIPAWYQTIKQLSCQRKKKQ